MGDFSVVLKTLQGGKKFYSQGWNARVNNEPYDQQASPDWKIGWRDCEAVPPEERSLV